LKRENLPRFSLYLITDRRLAAARGRTLADVVARACDALPRGAVAVQLREKDLEGRALLELGASLREATARAGALFFVNDRADVARALGADGVHLPGSGLAIAEARRALGGEGLVGVSTHASSELELAADEGADFAVLGPVYETASKRAYGAPLGEETLREGILKIAAKSPSLPVYALGGIDAARAARVVSLGAAGVACISAVLGAADPGAAAAALAAPFVARPGSPC